MAKTDNPASGRTTSIVSATFDARSPITSASPVSSVSKSGPCAKTTTADPQPDRVHHRLVSAQHRFRRRVASAGLNRNQVTVGKRPIRRRIIGLLPVIPHELGWRTSRKVPILVHPVRIAVPALGSHIHPSIVTLANIARRSRAATLVAVRPWVTATLIVQTRPRLGLRGRPAVWRLTASERWLVRGRRGRSTSW
jgi:hypothetical protein